MLRSIVFAFCAGGLFSQGIVRAAQQSTTTLPLGDHYQLKLSEPVVAAMASPEEHRWGQYQFPTLSAYPGGKVLLRYHAGEDSVRAYGHAEPALISNDNGSTWQPAQDSSMPYAGLVGQVLDGEYLCAPMPKPLEMSSLPKPVGQYFCYRKMLLYRVEDFPSNVGEFLKRQPSFRWEPAKGKWLSDESTWDMRGRMVWIAQGNEAGLISGITFERPPIEVGKELLWADYRALYAMPDGSAPKGCGCSCMVSTNNGRTWQFRAPIANANGVPGEISNMTEPVMCLNSKGALVCVLRRTDQAQKSMLITYSRDQGRTWEIPRALDELGKFGVMPDLLQLKSGPLILTYGRPGVNLTVSLDGSGGIWQTPLIVHADAPGKPNSRTDGYTSLRAIGPNEFLMSYTDFQRLDDQGRKRKAVLVRRLSVEKD